MWPLAKNLLPPVLLREAALIPDTTFHEHHREERGPKRKFHL